ncbi:MaoC/PaaZ C-terminal domain-containing protein [Spelaeicoccus albus]
MELTSTPSLPAIYASAAKDAGRRRFSRTSSGVTGALPDTRYRLRAITASAERLTAYQHLVGEPAADRLPACFVHVLSFPVAMSLMAASDFPLPLMGMVHLDNRIDQFAPIVLGEAIDIDCRANHLRAHHRGTQVDVTATARVGGTVRWHSRSTYLAKGVFLDDDDRQTVPRPEFEPPTPTGLWALPGDIGRRYARVSGDYNPIHLSSAGAKLLGFRRAIAHGMYLAARAVAASDVRHWDAMTQQVSFGSPAIVPGRVAFAAQPNERGEEAGAEESRARVDYVGWNAKSGRKHFSGSIIHN